MTSIAELNKCGADLEQMVCLRSYPIAIKLLKNESEIPAGAVRPKKDRGEHYALCQVFSLARRQGMTIAMFVEDHWGFAPIISYGLGDPPQDYLDGFSKSFFLADKEIAAQRAQEVPRLPVSEYPGMTIGPLKDANFEPDVVMVYCTPGQLRHLLISLRYLHGTQVTFTLDPWDSCVRSILPSFLNQEPAVSIPDPGDFERAGAGEDELVFSVPTGMLEELMTGLYHFEEIGMGFRKFRLSMEPDFKQPPFYEEYFRKWGLDGPAR